MMNRSITIAALLLMLAQIVPVWHLDCLPDEAAARLCCNTCAHGA